MTASASTTSNSTTMASLFHISHEGKNARVNIHGSQSRALPIIELNAEKLPVESVRIVRGIKELPATPETVEALITSDPEIDLNWAGRIVDTCSRAFFKRGSTSVESAFEVIDVVFNADGTEKERRPYAPKSANSNHDTFPVVVGKFVPVEKFLNSFVITRTYALLHDTGVTFDFLFQLAKKLADSNSVALLGAGAKGNAPIIFQDGGKGYRCALMGKIEEGNRYQLLVLVLGQELKLPAGREATVPVVPAEAPPPGAGRMPVITTVNLATA